MRDFIAKFGGQAEHLLVWTSLHVFLLFVATLVAKYLAVCKTFGSDARASLPLQFLLALPWDLLTIGALFAAAAASFLPSPGPVIRRVVLLCGYLFFALLFFITFANEEFYASFGSPLKYHLVALAPAVGTELLRSGIWRNLAGVVGPLVLLVLSVAAMPYLCARLASPGITRARRVVSVAAVLALAGGAGLALKQPENMRAAALRELTLAALLKGESKGRDDIPPPSPMELKTLADLTGGVNADGERAFSMLEKKKYNIVIWVWESVGMRYLKSYHALGQARTPNLDRLTAAGSVNFSNCHCECPLTVQTSWSIVAGTSPPARPIIFTNGKSLPQHAQYLPSVLKANDYQSAHFNSSHLSIWGMDRFMNDSGFDVLEDCDHISAERKNNYKQYDWGIDDRFLVDSLSSWLDAKPKSKPFFAMLWNIETHHPYTWRTMVSELDRASDAERYVRGIEYSDTLLGQAYDALVQRGLAENTIFIVVGDHGEGMGRTPRPYERGHSMLVFEDSVHVPLVFINPAFKQMHTVTAQCSPVDLYPTLLDLTESAPAQGSDGSSLTRPCPPRLLYSRSIVWWPVSIRAGPHKLVLGSPEQLPELYNVDDDPSEANDIASSQVDTANVLMAALLRMSADRYKHDPSFEFGFSLAQPASANPSASKRPPVSELLK